MPWPLASHFSAMLQSPAIAFRDPELARCRIEKDERNQPRPWAGAFAVVYKGIHPDGSPFAIRVFVTESPERRERYDRISEYLKTRQLGCLVPFEYRDRSIRSASDGKWYPLVLMDWVEGETLYKWVHAKCLVDDREALSAAARGWLVLVKELADAQIAHGDLQHANVMVTPEGRLKLVDYDCMCVPALVGRRNLEVGVEPYQHPQRDATTLLGPDLDRFSALAIFVALRALAAEPGLWQRHVEGPAYDKLLLRKEDFQSPGTPLRQDLARSPDDEVRELAAALFELARGPMDQVPPLVALADSFAKVEALLRAQSWEPAVELLNRRGQFSDAPEAIKPLIRQAYEHVYRGQAWQAVAAVPEGESEKTDRQLLEAWNEPMLAGFGPAEQLRPRLEAARARIAVLDRLRHLIQQSSREIVMAEERMMVELAGQLPAAYAHSLAPRIERARQRVETIGDLRRAVLDDGSDDAILKAWRRVQRKQCQDLVPEEFRRQIAVAEQRRALVESLRQTPADLAPDQLDRRILELWREDVLGACPEAARWRPVYETALRRQEVLGRLRAAVEARDEGAVARLAADPLLAGYALPPGCSAVVRATSEKLDRVRRLADALAEGRRDEFVGCFDARLIREHAVQFAASQARLTAWTRADVLPLERLGLGPAVARASLTRVDRREGTWRLRWTWPQPRHAERCLVAVCPAEPGPDDDPREVEALHREAVDREGWESAGGSRVLHAQPGWSGACVAVWAEVDLGLCVLFSPPLALGRLDERPDKRGGLRGMFGRTAPG